MSRMFLYNGKPMKTWNVQVGCRFDCLYCNARRLALGRLKHNPKYRDGFEPSFIESELSKKFKPGDFVFIGYMGDISFAREEDLQKILNVVRNNLDTRFLMCTKDPSFYRRLWDIPDNLYFGATIETNIDYNISFAPPPETRFYYMQSLSGRKFLSIEPVMDFDLETMIDWVSRISPMIVEVGADNYHNNLPEPPPEKLEALLTALGAMDITLVKKPGLERLLT